MKDPQGPIIEPDPDGGYRKEPAAHRWWHSALAFLPLAGLWLLFFASGHQIDWDSLILGAITSGMVVCWAIEFTGNKTAHTILKEWSEELSRRPDKR